MSETANKLFLPRKSRNQKKIERQEAVLGYKQLSSHRRMSLVFLFIWLILIAYGLMMMFSASYGISFVQSGSAMRAQSQQIGTSDLSSPIGMIWEADATKLAKKQAFYMIGGALAAIIFAVIVPFRQLMRPSLRWIVYIVVTLSLVYTFFRGESFNGAKRWMTIAGITFQSSELAKVGAVFFLASYFSSRLKGRGGKAVKAKDSAAGQQISKPKRPSLMKRALKDVVSPGILMIIWVILIVIQPHLSGAIILTMICLVVFFFAPIPPKVKLVGIVQLLVIILVVGMTIGAIYEWKTGRSPVSYISQRFSHAARRLDTFQNREAVSVDDRMQIDQAEIALGSGGLTGKGLGKSVQKLNWLSEAHNDFILSIIGEELGFLGIIAVIILFIAFLVAGLMVARRAATPMSVLVAAGYTVMIAIQAFLNMAVAVSLIPATGISLPFFSYGGTANIFFSFAAGFVLCVSKSGKKENRELAEILDSTRQRKNSNRGKSDLEDDSAVGYAIQQM
ncbi:MAG: FtsW/RodA/SpoVE family cell cycle protein [Clostridiaceae bacterium]|nr:FtsW/RodA/SpoVE family cell cycle protein [Clostridiaceae bacterium]